MTSCATITDLFELDPRVKTLGPSSKGSLQVVSLPSPGDTFGLQNLLGDLPAEIQLVAVAAAPTSGARDFEIGADEEETARNITTSVNDAANGFGSWAQASTVDDTVYFLTTATGPLSAYTTISSTVSLVWNAATLSGGADTINNMLASACCMTNLDCWGKKANQGSAYLALHYLYVSLQKESTPTNRKKIDKIETSSAPVNMAGLDSSYATTHWGRLYLQMRDSLIAVPTRTQGACRSWLC